MHCNILCRFWNTSQLIITNASKMSWWYECTLFGMRFSHFFADFPCCFFWSKAWKGKPETNINLASITTFPTCHASETINFKGNTLHSSHIVGHVEAFEGQYLIFLMELFELILQIKQRLSWNACRLTSPRYPQVFIINLFLPSSCTAVPWPVLANSYKANGVFYQASQEAYIPSKNLASYLRRRGE